MVQSWRNWAGSVRCHPHTIARPGDEIELADLIRRADGPVRVAGSGHSFTPIVATNGLLLELDRIAGLVSHDSETHCAVIRAGTTIHDLGPALHGVGLGLINQGDIDVQAIAGAIGTGTHGTGPRFGSLSTAVRALRLVTASGDVVPCSPEVDSNLFHAAGVSFGSLGVFSEITLQCRPAYRLQEKGRLVALEDALDRFSGLSESNRHVEFFWFPHVPHVALKTLSETDEPAETISDAQRHHEEIVENRNFRILCEVARFLPFLTPRIQGMMSRGFGGPRKGPRWSYEAFPSVRSVRFNEMEYAVPLEDGPDCVREIGAFMKKSGINFAFPIEYRTVAADDLWLSPFFERPSATISVHQYAKQDFSRLFDGCEAIFRRYAGRPHWGKRHSLTAAELRELYPRWDAFQDVRRRVDPDGKFMTPYLHQILGA